MTDIFWKNSLNLIETRYAGVFGTTDYEFEENFKKLEMSDSILKNLWNTSETYIIVGGI